MTLIDGIEYIARNYLCCACKGSGDYEEEESGLWWYQSNCPVCDGGGVREEYCGCCIQCEMWTVNKSYGEFLCVEHDASRRIEIKNYPDRYEGTLL